MRVFPDLLKRTMAFHRGVVEQVPDHSAQLLSALSSANQAFDQQGFAFAPGKPMRVALSALLLTKDDYEALGQLAMRLHRIVEWTLDRLVDSPELLAERFPEHREIVPYLARTRGVDSWQVHSRYDFMIDQQGRMKLLELNVARPGGLMISEAVARETRTAFERVGQLIDLDSTDLGTIRADDYVDKILAIEFRAGIEPATIGILHDENELTDEFDFLEEAFVRRGREVIRADARDLNLAGEALMAGDKRLSLTYNKFRIRHTSDRYDCWQPGFQQRYAAFLEAQQRQTVVSLSNLCGFTLADNKAILAQFHDPEFIQGLADDDRQFLLDYVPWTHRLGEGKALYHEDWIDLLPSVAARADNFVIKPACQSRGVDVVVGRYASAADWQAACLVDPQSPKIVQEFAETSRLPIVYQRGDNLDIVDMNVVLGLVVVCGEFMGVISRISPNPVANVARGGFGQAVLLVGEH